jgi:hypothetical protein
MCARRAARLGYSHSCFKFRGSLQRSKPNRVTVNHITFRERRHATPTDALQATGAVRSFLGLIFPPLGRAHALAVVGTEPHTRGHQTPYTAGGGQQEELTPMR